MIVSSGDLPSLSKANKASKTSHGLPLGSPAQSQNPANTFIMPESTDEQPLRRKTSNFRDDIFLADAPKATVISVAPPDPRAPVESTLQLVFCARLLIEEQLLSNSQSSGTDDSVLDEAGRRWLKVIQEDHTAQARIRWLVSRLVAEFIKDPSMGLDAISEVVLLGPVLSQDDHRALLSCFIKRFGEAALLDVGLLQGMIHLLLSTPANFLADDDLVRIVECIRMRLESTHVPSKDHTYQLLVAVSKVLEVMVRGEVKGLNRQRVHQPLLAVLCSLEGVDDDDFLQFQINYAYQASLNLPGDETSFQAFLRYVESIVARVSAGASVFELDPKNALGAVEHLQQVTGNAIDVVMLDVDGARALQATMDGASQILEKAYWSAKKQSWFLTLQVAHMFIQEGRLADFNKLVCNAACRFDANFQRGLCQILGEVALSPLRDVESRRNAVNFLGELFKTSTRHREDTKIKKWIVCTLNLISKPGLPGVSDYAHRLLEDLQNEQTIDIVDRRPILTVLPLPTSSPLLDRVQDIRSMDYDIDCMRFQRLEDFSHYFSIPLRAKATLMGSDDQSFPLMERVQQFLESDNRVFLLLGDSGSGKSTFCRQLEYALWSRYDISGRMPLYINLPSINKPEYDLVGKHLRHHHSILDPIIQDIKRQRQVVLICDGYDESRLKTNIYVSNGLHQLKAKMVIACRNTFLGREYQGDFRPHGGNKYDNRPSELFEEATIVPFSESDIQDYVRKYIDNLPVQLPSDNSVVPSYNDVWKKLNVIPNMMNLVSNPFLLTLALRALPSLSIKDLRSKKLKVMQQHLYDGFVQEWVQLGKKRLQGANLKKDVRAVFEDLVDADFADCVVKFLKGLAEAIFVHQNGRPEVEYIHRNENGSWKTEFFGPEIETTLLRESSPLTRVGIRHWFIHKALLEYFFSLIFFDPNNCDGNGDDGGDDDGDDDDGDDDDSDDDDGDDDDPQGDGDESHGDGGDSFGGGVEDLMDDMGGALDGDGSATEDSAGLTNNDGGSSGGGGNSSSGNGGSSDGNGRSSDGNGGSTSGHNGSSSIGGNSAAGSSGGSSGGNDDSSQGDKDGSNGDEDGSRRRKGDNRSNKKGTSTKSHPSASSDPFSRWNLFKEPPVLQFLVERARLDIRLTKRLLSIIQQAKSSPIPSLAAANAIIILFKSGNRFQDDDLDGINVPSDYMSTGISETVQQQESGLTAGDLMKALLTPAVSISSPAKAVSTSAVAASTPSSTAVTQATSTASVVSLRLDAVITGSMKRLQAADPDDAHILRKRVSPGSADPVLLLESNPDGLDLGEALVLPAGSIAPPSSSPLTQATVASPLVPLSSTVNERLTTSIPLFTPPGHSGHTLSSVESYASPKEPISLSAEQKANSGNNTISPLVPKQRLQNTTTAPQQHQKFQAVQSVGTKHVPIHTDAEQGLAHMLNTQSPLTTLDFRYNPTGDDGAVVLSEALKTNSTLASLDLWNNSIGDNGAVVLSEALQTNSTLTTLDLTSNSIGDNGAVALFKALKTNSTLTTLNLWNNSIGDNGAVALSEALKTNSTLTTLDLQYNSIGHNGAMVLSEALKTNSTLTTLKLWSNSIGDNGSVALSEALRTNSTLTTLNLAHNAIGHNGAVALSEALKTNSTLTTLNLWNNSIGDNGAVALSEALKTNSTLTTLDLGNGSIGDNGSVALSEAVKTNSTLTTLDLQFNSIGHNGAVALSKALKTNSTLTTLNLWNDSIGDNGAVALFEALKTNSTLTTLNLANNSIRHYGAVALSEALKTNSTLTTLNLQYNSIGENGAVALSEALKTNSTLTTLNLQYNSIGENGAVALSEALKTNSTLTTLDLGGNPIGDKRVTPLSTVSEAKKRNIIIYR